MNLLEEEGFIIDAFLPCIKAHLFIEETNDFVHIVINTYENCFSMAIKHRFYEKILYQYQKYSTDIEIIEIMKSNSILQEIWLF